MTPDIRAEAARQDKEDAERAMEKILRDVVAVAALVGFLLNTDCMDKIHDATPDAPEGAKMLARAAYLHADKMMEVRREKAGA